MLHNWITAASFPRYQVATPGSFSWSSGFNFYRRRRTYKCDFDPQDYDFSGTATVTYYFNAATGNDSNSGLTPSLPKLTIHTVITALNSSPPANGAVFILQTNYDVDIYSTSTVSVGFDLVIKSDSPGVVRRFGKGVTDGITITSLGSGAYRFARAAGISNVLDYTFNDSLGYPRRLRQLSSLGNVQANPGSYYAPNSTTIEVQLWDSRAPDSSVIAYRTGGVLILGSGCSKVYAEDVIFIGGKTTTETAGGALDITKDANSYQAVFNNCVFGWCFYGLKFWVGNTSSNTAICLSKSCKAIYNSADGFNYHNTAGGADADIGPNVLEVDCIGRLNGWDMVGTTTAPNNNGSTVHDGCKIIRVNGTYYENGNRNIHDVSDGTQVWMMGCAVGNAGNQSSNDDSIDYDVGGHSGSDDTTTWLDGCRLIGSSSLRNLRVNTDSFCYYRNMSVSGWSNTINGTLSTY